jgi:hypothetical protein
MIDIMDSRSSNNPHWITRPMPRLIIGLMLTTIFCVQFQLRAGPNTPVDRQALIVLADETVIGDPFELLMRRDPLAALIEARIQHLEEVVDYECLLVKQELLTSGMSKEQEIKVKFRHMPYSVLMEWQRNPGLAVRVLYVKGRWTDATAENPEDRELALAQPGVIARIFLKSLKQPIHGKLAKKASRRFVDEFGFQKTLDRLIDICELGRSRGELKLEFGGDSRFDDRPVWVIRRSLPYTGEGGLYPDRTAEILVDKDYRVPVAVYCYSDEKAQSKNLIAKYEYRNVRMRVGLTEKDFEPVTYGM